MKKCLNYYCNWSGHYYLKLWFINNIATHQNPWTINCNTGYPNQGADTWYLAMLATYWKVYKRFMPFLNPIEKHWKLLGFVSSTILQISFNFCPKKDGNVCWYFDHRIGRSVRKEISFFVAKLMLKTNVSSCKWMTFILSLQMCPGWWRKH